MINVWKIMRISIVASFFIIVSICANGQPRSFELNDFYKLTDLSNPKLAPDGRWIVYEVSSANKSKDTYESNLWMVAVDGSGSIQLTYTNGNESAPDFSPDGRYISFLSSRDSKTGNQVWLLDRRGGEARKVTALAAGIQSYTWLPDGSGMILSIHDSDQVADSLESKPDKPIVINRYAFKDDEVGYKKDLYTHLYKYTITGSKLDTLTRGPYDDSDPTVSPDGKQIVFVSNRSANPDQNFNSDLWLLSLTNGSKPTKLTAWGDYDRSPEFSPDGKFIAYLRSRSPLQDIYDEPLLAVIPVGGGEPVLVTQAFDRPVSAIRWSKDGRQIYACAEDDRRRYVVAADMTTGALRKITFGDRSIKTVLEHNGSLFFLMTEPTRPAEIYRFEGGNYLMLTSHNEFLANVKLVQPAAFEFPSKDKVIVGGILYKPEQAAGKKLPLLLWVHGGPVAQDEFEFDMMVQYLAAQGYAVAQINYRGSNGKGYDFSKAISGDWGNKEVMDLIAGTDYLISTGVADPAKLAIGGWSYGGILTNYVTARDSRFKAGLSGAGSALQLSMYGTDQYVNQYEQELGAPWKSLEKWMKVSYPFFKNDAITTPTLYMASEKDFNVPVSGSEQMYQAMKSRGIPTQLIIYPDQHHMLMVPSYWIDRAVRYKDWLQKYVK